MLPFVSGILSSCQNFLRQLFRITLTRESIFVQRFVPNESHSPAERSLPSTQRAFPFLFSELCCFFLLLLLSSRNSVVPSSSHYTSPLAFESSRAYLTSLQLPIRRLTSQQASSDCFPLSHDQNHQNCSIVSKLLHDPKMLRSISTFPSTRLFLAAIHAVCFSLFFERRTASDATDTNTRSVFQKASFFVVLCFLSYHSTISYRLL